MIRYLTHNQIDTQGWDDCIEHSLNGNVYSWSWYLDVVHPGWEALVEDDYQTVMPLTGNRKFGVNYLFQPFFTQKLGVFSKNQLSDDDVKHFLDAIPPKYRFADFRINNQYKSTEADIYLIDNHRNIELDLASEYTVLYEKYSSNTKRNLAKAKKENLSIAENAEPLEIIELFRSNKGKEIKHWGDKEYSRLLNLVNTAKNRGCCSVLGTQNTDNQIVAGAFFMTSHNRIVFLFSGSDESNKDSHALTFLIDFVIEKFSGKRKIFDFEGSDNDGLARFYRGFGGEENFYTGIRFNRFRGLKKLILDKTKHFKT